MSKNKSIRVAIIGAGNCAKALVEGIQYYKENPDDTVGLMYPDIGGYTVNDITFVCGFDVDIRKVNKPLKEALRAKPNCAMDHVVELLDDGPTACIEHGAIVYSGPELDGIAPYMLDFPEDVSFRTGAIPAEPYERVVDLLKYHKVDVLINYLPVGSDEASRFYIDAAIEAKCHVINCIPTLISTKEAKEYEQKFINAGLTIVGSDMRSIWGASRLSEVLQGAMLDAGLMVTQHIQMNMAAGSTQGQENIRTGRTANCDFLNMISKDRLHSKHVSKENVLKGQNSVRNESIAGMTLYAGPSLTVLQKPGGTYVGSDNKIANLDIVAYGWAGARYEFTARLSCQDSSNSGGVVISAIRFCRVAAEMGIVGYLRGASAYTQKSPPLQLKTEDAKFECDALARREWTKLTTPQAKDKNPRAIDLPYTFQDSKTDYEK
jgi:myo-inositol-1-phosphate synthase